MSEMTQLQQAIQAAFPSDGLRMEEPLAQHTSFRIGGPCEVMAFPAVWEELSRLLPLGPWTAAAAGHFGLRYQCAGC